MRLKQNILMLLVLFFLSSCGSSKEFSSSSKPADTSVSGSSTSAQVLPSPVPPGQTPETLSKIVQLSRRQYIDTSTSDVSSPNSVKLDTIEVTLVIDENGAGLLTSGSVYGGPVTSNPICYPDAEAKILFDQAVKSNLTVNRGDLSNPFCGGRLGLFDYYSVTYSSQINQPDIIDGQCQKFNPNQKQLIDKLFEKYYSLCVVLVLVL